MKAQTNNIDKDCINLLMSCDDRFFKPFLTTLYSVIKNTESSVNLYFIGHLSQKQIFKVKKILGNGDFKIYDSCEDIFNNFQNIVLPPQYSQNIFFRIYAPYVFQKVDKLLWIDSDIIFTDDISLMFNYEMNGKLIAAWQDIHPVSSKIKKIDNYDIKTYFCSGIVLFNCSAIRKRYTLNKYRGIVDHLLKTNLRMFDQDILNIIFRNDVEFFPSCFSTYIWNKYNDIKIIVDNFSSFHYAGDVKPWQKRYYNFKNESLYWKYGKHNFALSYIIYRFLYSRIYFVFKCLYFIFKRKKPGKDNKVL